jgi:predicted unusual protein kinase regulating ubiquinone biosynthesis (AarF/ABC1/UbiB family)
VHAATLHSGEAVAVKLQYPGMAASVHSDLALLRGLLQTVLAGSTALPQTEVMERVLADVERTLVAELDYVQEAQNLRWFGQHLHLPGLVVPQPVETHSSARVLTMQHLSGVHLNEWLWNSPTQAERDHYGQLLFDSFMHCAFDLKCLQADPHPGNYLFMPAGRLGLLDFGCCQTLSEGFCEGLAQAWSARLRQPADAAALHHAYVQLGLISPTLSLQDFSTQLSPLIDDLLAWQVLPFAADVFDFGSFPPPPRPSALQHRAAMVYLQAVPQELPYFDRAYLGLIQMLRSLGARVRTRNPWISGSLWEGSQPHKVG